MQLESMMDVVAELKDEIGYLENEPGNVDVRLMKLLERGEQKLNEVAGCVIDYDDDLVARGLLIDFGRYAHSQVEDLFEKNYSSELASLNAKYSVKEYVESGEQNE
ncbi:MAG: hypothetical protein KBT46_08940 [Ruminococcus sp.]|nr:hypothetical protein [Candidatus Copronaster equi]